MVRRKVEMKRIENTSSRYVAFSKRRKGLLKKAQDLSVLCDADVAVIVFSARGRLYDFCTANSFPGLVERYRDKVDERSSQNACKAQILTEAWWQDNGVSRIANVHKCEKLQQVLDGNLEEYINRLNTTELTLLQEELHYLLKETTSRKTNLQLEFISALHEKENMLLEEKVVLQKEIAAAMKKDDEEEAEAEEEKNQIKANDASKQQLTTLSLLHW